MIVTKEQQESLVNKYVETGCSMDELQAFLDGMVATLELIDKLLVSEVRHFYTQKDITESYDQGYVDGRNELNELL